MNSLYGTIEMGPIALLVALISVFIYYNIYACAPEPKRSVSLHQYLLNVLRFGALAFVVGTIVGISFACLPGAGNLCGLVGFFGTGPLLSAAVIFLYAHFWAKNARRAP